MFRRRNFFKDRELSHPGIKDIIWLKSDSSEMTEPDWQDPALTNVGILLFGDAIPEPDRFGQPIRDDTFLMLLNASDRDLPFKIPGSEKPWQRVFDTFLGGFDEGVYAIKQQNKYRLEDHTMALFCKKGEEPDQPGGPLRGKG